MTSISATSASYSPLDLLKSELTKEVSSGKISASDETALSSALDDIDSALKSGASNSSSSTPPSQDDMQSKIDDLIQSEVSSGKLTSDQATELKNVFANTFSGGANGAGPPPPPDGSSDSSSTSSTDTSSSSSSATTEDLMKELIAMLQSATSQSTSYSSSGSSNASSSSSLLVDYSV